jgi:DNA-binding NarL/FixJ family response regulator
MSRRQDEVLSGLLRGLCNKDIANELGTSEQVVKNHCKMLYAKHGVHTRLELVMKIVRPNGNPATIAL